MPTVTLLAREAALVLRTDRRGWCRLELLQPRPLELGGETVEEVVGGLRSFLEGSPANQDLVEAGGGSYRCVLHLAGNQLSLCARGDRRGFEWIVRDPRSRILERWHISKGEGRRWIWALDAMMVR